MFASLGAHLVFIPVQCEPLTESVLHSLRETFHGVCGDFEARLIEAGFEESQNYVHLLVAYPPKVALSSLVNSLKGVSSRRLRSAGLVQTDSFWSPSYCAVACGDEALPIIRAYVERLRELPTQGGHHG